MIKHICYCLAALPALFACENAATSTSTTTLVPPNSSAVVSGAELLEALEGFWQNESDPALLLEIHGEKLRRIRSNQAPEEFELEAFSDCDATPCKADGASTGWCFTEKGANGLQCYRVLRCDNSLLEFTTSGNSEVFKFKKVKP